MVGISPLGRLGRRGKKLLQELWGDHILNAKPRVVSVQQKRAQPENPDIVLTFLPARTMQPWLNSVKQPSTNCQLLLPNVFNQKRKRTVRSGCNVLHVQLAQLSEVMFLPHNLWGDFHCMVLSGQTLLVCVYTGKCASQKAFTCPLLVGKVNTLLCLISSPSCFGVHRQHVLQIDYLKSQDGNTVK